jgi:hypothetical protein
MPKVPKIVSHSDSLKKITYPTSVSAKFGLSQKRIGPANRAGWKDSLP